MSGAVLEYESPGRDGGLTATPWGRRLLFAGLYASQGAPVGFIWWFLATKLSSAGVAGDRVSYLLALLLVPWTFKFLWAPAVDLLRTDRFGFRAWAASAQLVAGLAVLPIGWLDLRFDFEAVFALALLHATAAATQDVAIDAWAVRAVPPEERGRVTGWMQAGYRLAMWAFGYGLLTASDWVGRPAATVAVAVAIWSSSALLLFCREPGEEQEVREVAVRGTQDTSSHDEATGSGAEAGSPSSRRRLSAAKTRIATAFGRLSGSSLRSDAGVGGSQAASRTGLGSALAALLTRSATWLGLGVALLAGAAFESVGGLLGPFLIGRGFAESGVGLIGTCSVLGLVPGGLAGGWLADRLGRRATLAFTVLGIGYAVVALAYLDRLIPAPWPDGAVAAAVALLFTTYAGVGVLTASSYALFMDLSGDGDGAGDGASLGGTRFSAFMGATNGCEAWSVAAAGFLSARLGYGAAFALVAGASLLALPILAALRPSTRPPAGG